MARLEAIAKALYYPTPPKVTGMIVQTMRVPFVGGGVLLDPCAGEGHAAAFLARWWGLRSCGIELDAERATEAATRFDELHHGSYHQISCKPERPFSVLFLNPPYDEDSKDDGVSRRQEVAFLRATVELLCHDGLLVYVVPRRILANTQFRDLLSRFFRHARAYRFPAPEVEQFDQVVLFARRYAPQYGHGYYSYRGNTTDLDGELPTLGDTDYGDETSTPIPATVLEEFQLRGRAPETYAPSYDPNALSGAYATQRWALLTSEANIATSVPLVAPRPGHQAMLLAAGRLNGVEIDGHVMKGGSIKIVDTVEHENETIVRERIVSHLSDLSLSTGELETWRVDKDPVKTAEWFRRNGATLAKAILESHSPSFDGDLSRFDFSSLRAPGVLPGHDVPVLLDVQKEAAAATCHHWQQHKTTVLCGEQGTGKTTMAIVATSLGAAGRHGRVFKKVVVVCPSHLVPKWVRECGIITGDKRIARTARKLSEVDSFFQDPHARYLILSKEMAKLGCRWHPAFAVRKTIRLTEVTVRQGTYSYSPPETKIVRSVEKSVTCPSCGAFHMVGDCAVGPSAMTQKVRQSCRKCKAPLWSATPLNASGTKRWPLARYINRRYANRYALVIDECFPGDTKVATPSGPTEIAKLRVGDQVLSRTKAGETVVRRVVRVLPKRRTQPLVEVTYKRGSFTCTPDHKIWTSNRGYVHAQDLQSTDLLVLLESTRQSSDYCVHAVAASDRIDEWVYDIEVEDTHCYFADGVLVSNCHQHAGAESDQGRAVHMLAVAATKILAMTGTLYGGRASSLFHLLYRIDHQFREQYHHDECARFVQHHGLFETVYDTSERTSIYNYSKGRSGGRIREIPGMSPAMIPLLLPFCIFVKLKDLLLELPPYTEEVEIIDHDPAVEKAACELAEGVRTALAEHPQALGQYLMACLGYPDRPDQHEQITIDGESGPAILASAPAFPDRPWPKDLRVAEICRSEKESGRRCLVYFSQTHRRDARERVRKVLEADGLRVEVLDSNVAPEKREEWLREAEKRGFDVLLTNGRLVETGMDLLFAATIIQYGTEYSLATLRQSIRRSWRLGQVNPVRVIFMAYRNTMQRTAIDLIARKMRAAEMVDGDEAGGLAQHDVGGTNFLVELAHEAIATQHHSQPRRRPSRVSLAELAER